MSNIKQERPGSGAHLPGLTAEQNTCKPPELRTDFTLQHSFMYLNCTIGQTTVSALLDSGSSINIISRQFYDVIPDRSKFDFQPSDDIIMADNFSVSVEGTARIQFCTADSQGFYTVPVYIYILRNTSHPVILGIEYMKESGIILDFSKACHSAVKVSTKIVCTHSCVLPPNSETVIQGKLNKDVYIGMQGQCLGHSEMGHKGLLVAKAVVTCLSGHQVPVQILNPTAGSVHINKGDYLATFKLCDNYTDILSVRSDILTVYASQIAFHVTV